MPRRGRLHIAGGCYHVMGRGLERRRIFNSDKDKQDFLTRFGDALKESGAQCLAWAVMSNHYHLLIRVGEEPLSELMSPLLGGYAGSYNRRHRRSGYVFQNRFKSILCDENEYLLALVRYIHLNPVKAGMVTISHLNRYPWAGHAGLLGNAPQPWQTTHEVLSLFATRLGTARQRYRNFVNEGLSATINLSGGGVVRSYGGWENLAGVRSEHEQRIGDERILGASDFVELALQQDELALTRRAALAAEGWTLEKLMRASCRYAGIERSEIERKGRTNDISTAKALVCYFGSKVLGISMHQIAHTLNISQPAVSLAAKRGKSFVSTKQVSLTDLGSARRERKLTY